MPKFNIDKVNRYSLRKLSVGAASTVISASAIMLNANQVRADANLSNDNSDDSSQVSVDGSQVSNADLIDTSTSVNISGNTKTTTTIGVLDPKKNLSTDPSKEASLSSTVEKAQSKGLTTTQTATKTYGNVKDAGKDYADQIKNIYQNIRKHEKAMADYNDSLKKYDTTVHEYQVAKEEYEKALAQYQKEQKAYQNYQKQGISVKKKDIQKAETIEQATQKYAEMRDKLNAAISAYSSAMDQYNAQRTVYQEQKTKYDKEKQAYDEYQKQIAQGQGAGAAVAAQGLVFEQQYKATMTITGADIYMTKQVSDQLNSQDVISRFDKAKLDAMRDENGNKQAYQSTNPNSPSENTWLIFKKDQPVTVTYHDLDGVTYNGKNIDHVVYTYTLESSSDGSDEAMAQIMHDPTETIWVGSNSKNLKQHLRVKMDIAFYDQKGQKLDTSDGRAVLSLASLNHYTGVPYITDDGQLGSISMNHLERVNIGDNEFVPIPGSSVTLNEDGWVYAKNSNQRIAEGAQFDADDMYAYVNNDTNEVYLTTDSDISNNSYINVHGGVEKWTKGTKTTGWDSLPSATDNGKWPVNKYYGAGAMKLTGGTIYFDVSGNNPDFNTSYWFVINSVVAVPQDPGEEPKEPVKPTQEAEYNLFVISKNESVNKPTTPEPKFDHDEPGKGPTAPDSLEVEWHLTRVIEINQETIPDNPPKPNKPEEPINPLEPNVPTPDESGEPDNSGIPAIPDKLYDSQKTSYTKTSEREAKLIELNHENTSKTTVNERVVHQNNQDQLPQTGDDQREAKSLVVIGLSLIATLVSSVFALRKKKNR